LRSFLFPLFLAILFFRDRQCAVSLRTIVYANARPNVQTFSRDCCCRPAELCPANSNARISASINCSRIQRPTAMLFQHLENVTALRERWLMSRISKDSRLRSSSSLNKFLRQDTFPHRPIAIAFVTIGDHATRLSLSGYFYYIFSPARVTDNSSLPGTCRAEDSANRSTGTIASTTVHEEAFAVSGGVFFRRQQWRRRRWHQRHRYHFRDADVMLPTGNPGVRQG